MNYLNFNLTVWLQRVIELLSFYLILSNISGKDLKESLTRLIMTKQRILYGNMILLIGYPLAITFIIQAIPTQQHGHLIDLLLYPLIACFLLRRTFSLKKTLLSYISLMIILATVNLFAFAFSLNATTLTFLLLALFTTIIMSYQAYFEVIYAHLEKKNWLLNSIAVLSFVVYAIPFFADSFSIILLILLLLLFVTITIKSKLEISATLNRLKSATPDDVMQALKDLSSEHRQSNIIHQYIIQNNNIKKLNLRISEELNNHKKSGTIKDYECIAMKSKLKINVII